MTERTLGQRYRLDDKIGEGGMAIVYAGTDTVLRRRVAVKVLRPQFAADDEFVRRFYHEAEAAARLTYPNIVGIYDVGSEEGTYFIVMELVDGTTLAEMIDADGALPESVTIDYAEQICRGLAYAHRQGILHRDVKPANILITKDDVVKLSDFGIARAVTTQTMTMTMPGMVMGSVFYVSPEQAQGHDLRETSDLYSLGVVLYQMLCGKLPYTGESPVTVALKHVSAPVPEVDCGEGSNAALAAIVRKLLQKSPDDRYQSATDVASALREARERPVLAPARRSTRPPTIPNPPARRGAGERRVEQTADSARLPWTRRLSRRLIAILVLLLAAAGWIGYTLSARPGGLFGNVTALTVPPVTGNSSADARLRLAAAGFRVDVTQQPSETVDRDRVISQNPPGGGHTGADGAVRLVVSSGPPIVGVLDLRSYSRADAERYLHHADLAERVVERYDTSPAGTVLKQVPPPGPLPARSIVTLTVSKGPQPATVPSVVSLDVTEATAVLKRAHLRLQIGEKVASDNIPENIIASQYPDAGGTADANSAVTVSVSAGAASTAVPAVGGRGVGDAAAMLRAAGLVPAYDYAFEPGNPVGVVINASPAAGANVRHGSTVVLTVVVSGIVPDVAGMSLDQAKATLQNAGYQAGNVADTQSGTEGTVVSTEPRAGSTLKPGETILIYFNSGGGGGAAPQPSSAPSANPAASP